MIQQTVTRFFKGQRNGGVFCKAEPSSEGRMLEYAKEGMDIKNPFFVTRYTIETLEDFETLIPSLKQRMHIIQVGLNYIQNVKTNSIITEDNAPTEIDLREAINMPPTRKS